MSDSIHYEYAPISNREAGLLARYHGHKDVDSFAGEIPEAAEVLDVGAGYSTLGREVAVLRPDIRWLNVDLHYVKTIAQPKNMPDNLEHLPANVLALQESLGSRQFDRVLSYWLIPHVTLASRELGITAVRNMLEVAKPQGKISIGPTTGLRNFGLSVLHHKGTVTVDKPKSEQEMTEVAANIVEATKLGRFWGWMNRQANEASARHARETGAPRPAIIFD